MTLSDDLNKLDELRARGALTDEEFARAKERLLNAGSASLLPHSSRRSIPSAAAAPTAGSPAYAAASDG